MTRYFTAFATVAMAALPVALHAETTTDVVPVTATRLHEDIGQMPAAVAVITAEDIAKSPAKTLPDLLTLEAGIRRASLFGNLAADDSVDMRGFGATAGQNTLILLDGRRLNDVDLASVDFAAIPLGNIERIEIVHGAGGVLYGDSAVGGTINIVTRSPGRTGTTGSAGLSYASYDTRAIEASVTHGADGFAAHLFANRTVSDGYRDNNNIEQDSLFADLRLQQEAREWFVKFNIDDQNLRLPGTRTVDPGAGINELETDRRGTGTPNDYADQTGRSITAGVTQALREGQFTFDAGYRTKNQKSFFDDYSGFGFTSYLDTDLATWSLTPRLTTRYRLGEVSGELITGVDYYRSDYDSDRAQNPSTIGTPVHRLAIDQDSASLYAQGSNALSERNLLTLGARYQRVDLDAADQFDPTAPGAFGNEAAPLSQRDDEGSYELGLRHRFTEQVSAFFRAGRAVRFATVDELFELDPVTFANVFSPLKPQTSKGIDIGMDYAHGPLKASVSAYDMDLENEIQFNPVTFTNDNLDPTQRRGVVASFSVRATEDLRVKADYAYTHSEFREGPFAGNDVPLVARNTGSLSAFLDLPARLTLAATASYTGSKRFDNDQSNTFQKIPDYTLVDFKLAQTIGPWQWDATIRNVFDEKAFDYGARSVFTPGRYNAYPLPERNYWLSARLNF